MGPVYEPSFVVEAQPRVREIFGLALFSMNMLNGRMDMGRGLTVICLLFLCSGTTIAGQSDEKQGSKPYSSEEVQALILRYAGPQGYPIHPVVAATSQDAADASDKISVAGAADEIAPHPVYHFLEQAQLLNILKMAEASSRAEYGGGKDALGLFPNQWGYGFYAVNAKGEVLQELSLDQFKLFSLCHALDEKYSRSPEVELLSYVLGVHRIWQEVESAQRQKELLERLE
jgi:hypothetical protein